jgi:TonB family protein
MPLRKLLTARSRTRRPSGTPKKNHPNLRILFTFVPAMNRKAAFLLLAASLLQAVAAHADSLKDDLNHKYKKQVLALRTPFARGDQKFDSAGQPIGARSSGRWLTYGAIYVEKLNLTKDTLRLEGPRVALSHAKAEGKTYLTNLSKPVKVEIHLDQPLNSLDQANALLERVFFLEGDVAQHATPEFRRSDDNIPDDEIYHVSHSMFAPSSTHAPEDKEDKKDTVFLPRPVYTPEPEFSEQARRAKFQGTVVLQIVVNKKGDVVRVRLERALGMGLDQNAMEGVERWRFSPATRNGQPVAVTLNIEVAFNLY